MVKRVLKLKEKQCLVCGSSFEPASGAQMTCSAKCKAEARIKGLNKRGRRSGHDDAEGETREERLARIDRENPLPNREEVQEASGREFPPKRYTTPPSMAPATGKASERPKKGYAERFEVQVGSTSGNGAHSTEPSLEIDLSPLEEFVRQLVAQAVKQGVKVQGPVAGEELRDMIRQIVKEEIAERLRGLMG